MKELFLLLALPIFAAAQPVYPDLKTGKFGIYDPVTSEPITPNEFDRATAILEHDTLATVEKNGRAGIVSVSGRAVAPLEFDKIDAQSSYLEHGFVTVWRGEKCGKWALKTGRSTLPTEFVWVRGLFPDLLAARRTEAEILEFFDEKGQKRFETAGKTASVLFDGSAIEVQNAAGERHFLDKKGQPIFFGKIENGVWTDGQFVVAMWPKNGEQKERFGLFSMAGDTVLQPSTSRIEPLGKGRFFVKSSEKDRKQGFFDGNLRQWLLPMGEVQLFKLGEKGDPDGAVFASKNGGYGKPGSHLYDAAGQLLIENCQFSTSFSASYFFVRGRDDYRPFRFFECQKVGQTGAKGLFAGDGKLIVPMEFDQFWYRSEAHAVIANRFFPDSKNVFQANAFDLKTGQKLFAEDFEELFFTDDPTRFWAKKGGLWGLVERARPASARFEFDRCITLANGFFQLEKRGKWQLFGPKGEAASDRFFDAMMQASYENHRQFQASKKSKGHLVAFALDHAKKGGWWAIDDRKQHFFMPHQNEEMPDQKAEEMPSRKN